MTNEVQHYGDAVKAIKTAILQGQYEAAKGVNRVQLAVYFCIGRYVSLHSRKGVWGTGALKTISEQLQRELPGLRGYSATQMREMRLFYEAWEMLDGSSTVATDETESSNSSVATDELIGNGNMPAVASPQLPVKTGMDINHAFGMSNLIDFPLEDFLKVPFTHHSIILRLAKDLKERCYYIHRQAEEHLSVERLTALVKEDAYRHQSALPNNFARTMGCAALARKAVMAFKDSYLLNFINVEEIGERDAEDIDERVVENQIVHNVKKFMMTMGRDFAFIGNQQLLEVYGIEHFPDLLFFNRELNSLVVMELKTGAFKPSYLGQLQAYLRIADDKLRKPHENPAVGIVLCKSADKNYVEYMIQDYHQPMGVATYTSMADMPEHLRHALPDIEVLRKLLDVQGE